MNQKMRVTILSSLSQKKEINLYKNLWLEAGCIVAAPIEQPNRSLHHIVMDCFNDICNSDMVFVITKPDGTCGEGVTYELVYAERCGVPVIYNTQFTDMLEYYMSLNEEE